MTLAPERTRASVRNGDAHLPLSRYYTKPETYADGWRVDLLDIPKWRFMRINEIPS